MCVLNLFHTSGDKPNSSISVKCTTDKRSDTTTTAINDVGNNKHPSTTDTGNTYTDGSMKILIFT